MELPRLLLCAVPLLGACAREARDGRHEAHRPASALAPAPTPSALDPLVLRGEQLYSRGEYDSARVVWETARSMTAPGDSLVEPRILTWLGLAAWRMGDYPRARSLGGRALEIKLRRGGRPELAISYNALGLLAWNEGRLQEATRMFSNAAASADREGDQRTRAKSALNQGLVLVELGRFDEAEDAFQAALRDGRRLGEDRIEGAALTNLGMLRVWTGNAAGSLDYLNRARLHYRRTEFPTGEENALGQLGTAYGRLGDLRKAYAMLDTAAALAEAHDLREELAADLEMTGDLYLQAGDPAQALGRYERAHAIADSVELLLERGTLLRKQSLARAALGNGGLAVREAEAARVAHREAGAGYQELLDLLALVELHTAAGQDRAASRRLSEARALARGIFAPDVSAQLALADARLQEHAGDPRAVLRTLSAGENDFRSAELAWQRSALRARAYRRLSLLDSAVQAGRTAVAALERIRGSIGAAPLRTRYLNDKAAVYGELVVALLQENRIDEAFQVADAARGRALLEHLAAVRGDEVLGAPLTRRRTAEQLLLRLDALLERLRSMDDVPRDERGGDEAATRSALAHEVSVARTQYEALLTRIDGEPQSPSLERGGVRSGAEVRAALHPGELLLEYMVLEDRVIIFASTSHETRFLQERASADDLAARIALLRGLAGHAETTAAEVHPVSRALGALLIHPVERAGLLAGIRRLILVPHGSLAYLPFAVLHDTAGTSLATRYALSVLPSASALPVLRARRGVETPSGAGGDVFAPLIAQLPGSGREATRIHEVLGARVHLGSSASEGQLRRTLSQGGVVHIASHGYLNTDNPLFSRVQLSPGKGPIPSPADDGRLEVHEVLGLRIASPLVFLSGCETGAGGAGLTAFSQEEDYATLGQSFLYSGGTAVIATLWPVQDEGAAAFAARFYEHLRRLPAGDALQAAQRDMRRDPRYASPYHWAGYVLTGDGSVAVRAQSRGWRSVLQWVFR